MAKVSLRVYNREIEGLIEGGQLDEAVAHCQHILKTFPMHVDTYRLLGKNFLEARRYTDAADIFQRVLMVVPDDFVAHVGMSIIRDDEGKLDDSIWHMERAFEDQPSNLAIQGELRRLYGRRDGVEPSKIRLSRDALANMYAQGELFNQAIAEIRSVLIEDPNRPDLQIMLARAYYRAGQKVEAAEIAANLLKKYMYCMDALRILVDVLPGAAQTENTQVYRQRLQMLDPYSSFVTGSVFNTDQVADGAVNLERFDYMAGSIPASSQPEWASSLGIKIVDEKQIEPDQNKKSTSESAEQLPVPAPDFIEPIATPIADKQSVPDWMRAAGWKESSNKAQEESVSSDILQPAEPLAQADIPEWLKSLAPKQSTDKEASPEVVPDNLPSTAKGGAPEWLAGLGTVAADAESKPSQLSSSSQDNNIFPDWLKEMGDSSPVGDVTDFSSDSLLQLQNNEAPLSTQPSSPPIEIHEPDKSQVAISPHDASTFSQITGESKPVKYEEDTNSRFEGMEVKQIEKEEELLTNPENRVEGIPDWIHPIEEQPSESTPPGSDSMPGESLPLEPFSQYSGELGVNKIPVSENLPQSTPDETAQTLHVEEDSFAWLEGLTSKPDEKGEELLTKPENRVTDIPDWLRSVEEQPSASINPTLSQGTSEKLPLEPFPEILGELADNNITPSESFSPLGLENKTILPLHTEEEKLVRQEDLSSKHGEGDEELQTEFENINEEIPDWLRAVDKQSFEAKSPEPFPTLGETQRLDQYTSFTTEVADHNTELSKELSSLKHTEETAQPLHAEEESTEWLEGLSAEKEEKLKELGPKLEEHSEPLPDWIKNTTQDSATQDKVGILGKAGVTPEDDVTITTWLSKQDVEKALGKTRISTPGEQPAVEPSNDLPDWLKDLDKPIAKEGSSTPAENLPDWLSQPAQPADRGESAGSSLEISSESKIPVWVDETFPVPEPPPPTAPGEWISLEEKSVPSSNLEPTIKPPSLAVDTPVQRQILGGTGMLSRVPTEDKDAEILSAAQTALDAKQLQEAMQAYAKLIKKNHLLDEVIHDLREAIYRFPVDISIWQVLGDAYMRTNRLQDALDAYTKAEELLR